ncbi:MAG: D-lyxose/D-mannose family sugar isomerase [Ktedonobacteraceae bacterium]
MLTQSQVRQVQGWVTQTAAQIGIVLTPQEQTQIEVVDFGLSELERTGLQLVIYINNDRYCAKELIMTPRQTCAQHRHPPLSETNPGKQETFRCRWGKVWLYVEGEPNQAIQAYVPQGSEPYYTIFHEIELHPGDQYTIAPNTWHWFQSGDEGAIVSEFSSSSYDEFDQFIDPRIYRFTKVAE